jgi:hypothetical protein
MIRSSSRLVSPYAADATILLRGTGTAAYDTALLQEAIDDAPDGAIIDGGNSLFTLAISSDAYWYYASQPARPVYPAVKLRRSNITLRRMRFTVDRPEYASNIARPALFATDINLIRGTLENLTFEYLDFDFKHPITATLVSALHLIGVRGVCLRRNRYRTSGTAYADVPISANGSGHFQGTISANGFSDVGTVRFTSGTLPPEVEFDRDYYLRPATNTFRISETYGGAFVSMTGGPYTATAYVIQNRGRCLTVDNCDDVRIDDCDWDHIRQGFFGNCNRDLFINGMRMRWFSEGFDVDMGLVRGGISNADASDGFSESQFLDLANVVDLQVSGVNTTRVGQTCQIYVKAHDAEDYAHLYKFKYPWPCVFAIGTPGTITSAGCQIKNDMRFWIDEPDSAYTFPTGADKYTTYRAKNVDPDTQTFEFYADTDGTKASIALSGSPSGTFILRVISEDADMTPCTGVTIDNVTIADSAGISSDSDIMISTEREGRVGLDRPQYLNGAAIFSQDVTVSNVTITRGKRVLVNEARALTACAWNLTDMEPGTDSVLGFAAVFRQSGNADGRANSLLAGMIDDVSVKDSQGGGVYISRPETLIVDRIRVDGYNLQANDATIYGVRGSSMASRGGVKTLREITVGGGVAGSTATEVDFWPEVGTDGGTGKFNMLGPFACLTSGAIKVKGDLGNLILNQTRVIIPAQDTTAAATINYPLTMDPTRGGKVMAASVQTLAAIAGSDPNYTNLRFRKYNLAGVYENLTSSQEFDQDAVSANTNRDWGTLATNTSTDIYPGEHLVLEFTRAGTGSVTPVFVFSYAIVPFL